MNVIKSFDFLKVFEASEPEPESEFKFEFNHQLFSNVEFENTPQTSTLKTNRKIIEIDSNQSKNSSISKSINSKKSKFLILIIQSINSAKKSTNQTRIKILKKSEKRIN